MLPGPRGAKRSRSAPKRREYTVIVVGLDSRPVRRFVVTRRSIRYGFVSLAVAGAVLAGAATYAAMLARAGTRVHDAEQENARLRAQLDSVQQEMAHISATLDGVELRDARLRSTVGDLQAPAEKRATATTKADGRRGAATVPAAPTGSLEPPSSTPGPAESGRPRRGPPGASPKRSALPPELGAAFAALASRAERQEASLRDTQAYFDGQRTLLASSPSSWPVRGFVTSDFGVRLDPYTAARMMHRGLDIADAAGQPVFAPSDGTVTLVGTENGYGKVVEIDHGHGVKTRFGHLSEAYVKRGERIVRGTRVGAVGNTGRSTGPHLHYEVLVNGVAENPRKFMLE